MSSFHSIASPPPPADRKSTRLNSSHANISYAVFCLKKKKSRPLPRLPRGQDDAQRGADAHRRADAGGAELPLQPGGEGCFFADTATTEIYALSLHDALPTCHLRP